jgi:hypothetical protein
MHGGYAVKNQRQHAVMHSMVQTLGEVILFGCKTQDLLKTYLEWDQLCLFVKVSSMEHLSEVKTK